MTAKRYINSIRSAVKRTYAKAYWAYLFNRGTEPSRPAALGAMAAQAVRLELRDIKGQAKRDDY